MCEVRRSPAAGFFFSASSADAQADEGAALPRSLRRVRRRRSRTSIISSFHDQAPPPPSSLDLLRLCSRLDPSRPAANSDCGVARYSVGQVSIDVHPAFATPHTFSLRTIRSGLSAGYYSFVSSRHFFRSALATNSLRMPAFGSSSD